MSDNCITSTIYFTNTSTVTSPSLINNINWYINSQSQGGANTIAYNFTSPENNDLRLVATTNSGCIDDTVVTSLPLGDSVMAIFNWENECYDASNPSPIQFRFASADSAGLTYLWDFGDGNTSALKEDRKSVV